MLLTVGDKYVEAGATAADREDGDISGNIQTTGTVDTTKDGTYILTYTIIDSAQNKVSKTRTVIVNKAGVDAPPALIINGLNPTVLTVGDNFVDQGASAIDREDGDITSKVKAVSNVDTTNPGNYTVVYTVTDNGNNTVIQTRTVVVNTPVKDTPPALIVNGLNPMNLVVGDTYTEQGASAVDREDGDITSNIQTTGTVDTTTTGTYTITYTVTDSGNNTVTKTRTVNVAPKGTDAAPTLTIQGSNPLLLTVGDKYVEAGATAADREDGDISANIQTTGTVDTTTAGTYTITYTVTDSGNNTVTKTRTVNVAKAGTDTPPALNNQWFKPNGFNCGRYIC